MNTLIPLSLSCPAYLEVFEGESQEPHKRITVLKCTHGSQRCSHRAQWQWNRHQRPAAAVVAGPEITAAGLLAVQCHDTANAGCSRPHYNQHSTFVTFSCSSTLLHGRWQQSLVVRNGSGCSVQYNIIDTSTLSSATLGVYPEELCTAAAAQLQVNHQRGVAAVHVVRTEARKPEMMWLGVNCSPDLGSGKKAQDHS